jgi:hypothetical protein
MDSGSVRKDEKLLFFGNFGVIDCSKPYEVNFAIVDV